MEDTTVLSGGLDTKVLKSTVDSKDDNTEL